VRQFIVMCGVKACFFLGLVCCFANAQTPTISSVSPNPLGIGQSVTVSGTNFSTSGSVTFNGVTASTTSWTSTAIIATVPVGTTAGNVVVTAGGHSSAGFPFTLNNGPVNYFYDDLGRLTGVVDVNGAAAEYSYDAVGNIVSISRFTATQVSVINFSPESGAVGAAVSINGTGFSTTPSQNTVKFNGTTASVTSASNTHLQVTVPSGATTGPISVTSPNGTATSSTNFTVTTGSGSPTITSFSPVNGLATTAVTLTGTNFDATLANDKVRLNASPAVASSANPTTIGTTVPVATASGRFTVLTPAGTAVSSQDFFVPFGTHVSGDIGFTARIASNGSQSVTLAAHKIALVLFDGVEGQRVDVSVSGSTFTNFNLYLIAPDNTTVATTNVTSSSSYLPSALLSKTGTYTVGIDPGASTGSLTLTLSGDFLGTISIDGPPVTASTTTLYQDARLSFQALGQRIIVYATNVTNSGANLDLQTPSQTTQAFVQISNSPSGTTFFMDTQALGFGTYQLWIPHNGTAGGSETLQIVSVPSDFTAPLTLPSVGATGPSVRVPATGNLAVGQNGSLTFNVAAGQKVSLNVSGSTIGGSYTGCSLTLYDPNHNSVTNGYCGTGAPAFVDTVTLTTAGTYTLVIDPQGTATGSVSISLNNDADATGTIAIGNPTGTPVAISTTVAGQDARLSFNNSTVGQRIFVTTTSVSNPFAYMWLVTPTGAIQGTYTQIVNSPSGQTFYMDTQTLSATGTYQLWIQHTGTNIGGETLQINSVAADFTGTLTVPAAGATGTAIRVPSAGNLAAGQNASLTFSATAGQQLSFNVTGSTIGSAYTDCLVSVIGPSPSTTPITNGYCGVPNGNSDWIDTVTIPTSGTYTFVIDPQKASTGTVSISINNDQDVTTPTISIGGSAVTARSTAAGQDVRLSFTPTAAQPRIVISATNVSNPSGTLNLWTGTSTQASVAINNSPSGQTFFIDTQNVNASQQYQIWVQHIGTNVGAETLQIKTVPADISHTVTVNGAAYLFSTVAGQNANIGFTISTSESITVHWTSGTYPSTLNCYMTATGPSPSTNQVGFGNCNTATGTVSLGTLAAGTYNILVDPQKQSTGGMSLTVTTP
jgi:YD repeat-containing protein